LCDAIFWSITADDGAQYDDVSDDADYDKPEMSDPVLCDVMDTLLGDIPPADYPPIADTLPPRWTISQYASADWKLFKDIA